MKRNSIKKIKKHKENGEKSWLSRQEGLRSIAIQDLTTTAVLECLQAKTVFSRKKNVGEVACCRQFSFGQTIIFFTVEVVVNCENDRVYATRKHSRMYPNTFESGVMFWTPVASNSSLGIPWRNSRIKQQMLCRIIIRIYCHPHYLLDIHDLVLEPNSLHCFVFL